jgi:hypothetical protein
MMGGFVVAVRTFNRPARLLELLEDLVRERPPNAELRVTVFDDHSTIDNTQARTLCAEQGWRWVRHPRNFGKRKAWRAFDVMFRWLKAELHPRDLCVFLDDDMRLCEGFFARVARTWKGIRDRRKSTLHLMVDASRRGHSCWTAIPPKRVSDEVALIQWVDGSFVADSSFFRALHWRVDAIPPSRWASNPHLSTGVGRQLSQRLVAASRNLYQVNRSLVVHAQCDSRMNPGLRKTQRLETVDFVDGESACDALSTVVAEHVEASVASIPQRHKQLRSVLATLRGQVDVLRVYLNGYKGTPGWVRHYADDVVHSDRAGDRGDAGKFYWCQQGRGVQLTVDDDIAYPDGYAQSMVAVLRRFGMKVGAGVHGVLLREPLLSYYADRTSLHFASELEQDTPVHVLGTGCLAYHAESLALKLEDFEAPNMADVWFALAAQRQRLPLVAIARRKDWLRPLPTSGPTIYDAHRHDDAAQTRAIRRIWPWQPPSLPALRSRTTGAPSAR